MSDHRCRLCTTNDVEGLADEMAAEMWEATRDHTIDPAWEGAGDWWQGRYRLHARTFLRVLRERHGS